MTKRQRTITQESRTLAPDKRLWLFALPLLAVPAALLWREYPAIVRYLKIERM